MPPSLTHYEVACIIDEEDELASEDYINNKQLLDIICGKCGEIYQQNFDRYRRGHRHKNCIHRNYSGGGCVKGVPKYLNPIECKNCLKKTQPRSSKTVFCSMDCMIEYCRTDEYRELCKERGREGGKKSATIVAKRSKNEILFAELCKEYFDEVLTNEPLFDGWDSDIIIQDIKVAVSWNGLWHYKKLRKNHNVEQVQHRDALKKEAVESNGYTYYAIEDLGKHCKTFVKQKFDEFIDQYS